MTTQSSRMNGENTHKERLRFLKTTDKEVQTLSCTDLLVCSNEPRSFCLQLLLQTGGSSAACGVARKLQLQFPDFLLLSIALGALSVNILLHLDQLGLDLLQLCTKLEEVTEHEDDKRNAQYDFS